ncbi:MAG: hypothetical protein QXV81_01035 [Ignisphaera sp.]
MDSCKEYVKPMDIEGYAMMGMIVSATTTVCDDNRERVVVELNTGEMLCTPCISVSEAKLCKKIIEFYKNIEIAIPDDDRYYHVASYRGDEEDARR